MTGIDPLHSNSIVEIVKNAYSFFTGPGVHTFLSTAPYYIINIFARFVIFSLFFSVAMCIVTIFYFRRMKAIEKKIMDKVILHDASEKENLKADMAENPKWVLIQSHINSLDANKWKLAILEADIMLADLLESLHLSGDTIADKLKAVDTSDFHSIEEAWEGHKIRNAIAHQGSDFLLNEREAKRVIGLYQKVFREFEMIKG
jgi:hypothetical protein